MGSFASYEARKPTILTVPGLGGSGRSHWQSLWEEARPDTIRVELGMWNTPHRNAWVTKLDQAIRAAEAPVILAAHSLGCLAVAWWAELSPQPYGWPVAGALPISRKKCIEQIRLLEQQRNDIDRALAELRQIYIEMFGIAEALREAGATPGGEG